MAHASVLGNVRMVRKIQSKEQQCQSIASSRLFVHCMAISHSTTCSSEFQSTMKSFPTSCFKRFGCESLRTYSRWSVRQRWSTTDRVWNFLRLSFLMTHYNFGPISQAADGLEETELISPMRGHIIFDGIINNRADREIRRRLTEVRVVINIYDGTFPQALCESRRRKREVRLTNWKFHVFGVELKSSSPFSFTAQESPGWSQEPWHWCVSGRFSYESLKKLQGTCISRLDAIGSTAATSVLSY